jgi:uncharacterized protein YgbK (DUF1537 family)
VTTTLAIVADDLTGGCDAGTLFAAQGPVPLAIWPRRLPPVSVGVIDTESRTLARRDAADRVRSAVADTPAPRLFKKIDSTLRGRIGAETEALMAARGLSTALFCPAFPAQKRVVVNRVLTVDGVPVSASAVADDPEFPAAPAPTRSEVSDVLDLLRPQFEHPLGWIPLERVRGDVGILRDHLARLEGRVVLADAETDADLDALVHAALTLHPDPLLVGSAGLAGAVARRLGLHGSPVPLPPVRRWLIVAGSRHPATRRQVAAARAANLLVVTTPDADRGDRAMAARHVADEARKLLDEGAADLVMVTGGETAAALFQALGASRIDLVGAPRPGLALGYLSLPDRPPLPVVTKAGGFGADDLLVSLATSTAQNRGASRDARSAGDAGAMSGVPSPKETT